MSANPRLADQQQKAALVVARAIRKIRTEGWCQGTLFKSEYRGDGTYHEPTCVGGAIYRASRNTGAYCAAMTALQRAIGTGNVPQWNDAPERTQAEVVHALREALVLLSEGERG